MSQIRLIRCFCYGILISSVLWLVLIYTFLHEVSNSGTDGLPVGRYSNQNPNRVRMVAKPRSGPRVFIDQDDDGWKENNFVLQEDDRRFGNDLNRYERLSNHMEKMKLNPKIGGPVLQAASLKKRNGEVALRNGAMNAAVDLNLQDDEIGMVRNDEERNIRDTGYRKHAFNELISQRLGFHRNFTDSRHPLCKYQVYSDDLPSTSIIICFYNEAWSTLLRTVYSVLDRTPRNLIHEIILVDDFSEFSHLKEDLDDFVANNFGGLVRVIHNDKREGLIRARVIGARHARGEVLMFLDSHCEVNEQWLEPLLERIRDDSKTVVCPIIDIINADSFVYTASPLVKGGFNWGMHFKWDSIKADKLSAKEDYIKPIQSPTMAGGLFAMDREYFHHLGEYDEGMDIWGGENLEISFRIWQCGGRLEIIPCSRIGHVFRKRRPYGSPGHQDTTTKNAVRVAQVWMDEYKEHYFNIQPRARDFDYGDISSRVALRKKLNCKSFEWYLKNIYPEMRTPDEKSGKLGGAPEGMQRKAPPRSLHKGKLKHKATEMCLVTKTKITKGAELILGECEGSHPSSMTWYQSSGDEFKLGDSLCLDMAESNSASLPQLRKCDGMGGSQRWLLKNGKIYHPVTGQCLTVQQLGNVYTSKLDICRNDPMQEWAYESRR